MPMDPIRVHFGQMPRMRRALGVLGLVSSAVLIVSALRLSFVPGPVALVCAVIVTIVVIMGLREAR